MFRIQSDEKETAEKARLKMKEVMGGEGGTQSQMRDLPWTG